MPKILLVEDNEMNRDMLSRRLQRKGYSVVTAHDGQQGHSLACSEMPDLILMDISLPVMGGWEVTRLLKTNEATRNIPIIASSLVSLKERSEEHTSELQSQSNLVCRLLLEKKKNKKLQS